ncbi:WbqC family protein [Rhizobium ruizarguesonis]
MTITAVIHQPDFASYLGFFQRFLNANLYIVLDHVQFVHGTSKSWTHRDKIKTAQGDRWLTVGIRKPRLGTPINAVELATGTGWIDQNLSLLRENYRKSAGWSEVFPRIEALYGKRFELLADFNMHFLEGILEMLEITMPTVRSSTLNPEGHKNELLVELLRKVGATRYLSGLGARDYMRPELFAAAGIEIEWQHFVHPVYPQPFGEFIPYLSILDTLLNCGIAGTRDLLWSCK